MLRDEGGRGSKDAPGQMTAPDRGDVFEGRALRIAQAEMDTVTEILFRREVIGPDLDALHLFHEVGLRSLGPVWSRNTIFGHGTPMAPSARPTRGRA